MEGPSKRKTKPQRQAAQHDTSRWARKTSPREWVDDEVLDLLGNALRAMFLAGRVLMIGTAAGGRTVMLKTWVDGEPIREHVSTVEEMKEVLETWAANWREEAEDTAEPD